MAWSTRELADLAGTTVNTVRHYHRRGLLEQPQRRANGYKQYEVHHLVRLLQIRRLRDLGVPLDAVEGIGGADGESAEATRAEALRTIDAELEASIARLQRVRAEIAAVLGSDSSADVPAGFEGVASRMSTADRSLVLIYSQLYDEAAMADLRDMVAADPAEVDAAFEALPADADEETRARVAELLSVSIEQSLRSYDWLSDQGEHLRRSEQETAATFVHAVTALYNEAQRDVLARASALAGERVRGTDDTAPGP